MFDIGQQLPLEQVSGRTTTLRPVAVIAPASGLASPYDASEGSLSEAAQIDFGDALDYYASWPRPTVIISDGPYGVGGFPGDPPTPNGLGRLYEAHIAAWAERALPSTTLWFWNSEVGWAEVHPVLKAYGWRYAGANVWDKGVGHIAGNVNGKAIRGFPIVSEICVRYVRDVKLPTLDGKLLAMNEWLRYEWRRAGLPLTRTNEAAGVANAATRKWFTLDHLWYFPPPGAMVRLAEYATAHGPETPIPYFSIDRTHPLDPEHWELMRAKWTHVHGITNVWHEPALRGAERLRENGRLKCVHLNQKPLKLIKRIINASSDPADIVWEPFGGLCSGVVAARALGRAGFAAEINPEYYELAIERRDRFNAVGVHD
jgi:site-specific DNA-methyltransferase (adenine-specific)